MPGATKVRDQYETILKKEDARDSITPLFGWVIPTFSQDFHLRGLGEVLGLQ
jgi:hypothetical protein